MVNINAIAIPMDTKLPRSLRGGTSSTLNDRNPIQVVSVRNRVVNLILSFLTLILCWNNLYPLLKEDTK